MRITNAVRDGASTNAPPCSRRSATSRAPGSSPRPRPRQRRAGPQRPRTPRRHPRRRRPSRAESDRVLVHVITDGRDTAEAGREYVRRMQAEMDRLGVGRIVSVMGRFWAMDRDHRWDRVEHFRYLVGPATATAPTADGRRRRLLRRTDRALPKRRRVHRAHRDRRGRRRDPRRGRRRHRLLQLPRRPTARDPKAFVLDDEDWAKVERAASTAAGDRRTSGSPA